jgi:glucose uptake protein GlcU
LSYLHESIGFGLALMSMVLYGLYMVPRKRSSVSQGAFTFWMGLGILISTSTIGLVADRGVPGVNLLQFSLALASGIVWGTGSLAYCIGVKNIGLSRSTPIKNISAILGTMFGIIVFHEFSFNRIVPAMLAIGGSLAIVISATALASIESVEEVAVPQQRSNLFYGVLGSLWAAFAYSIYTIPMKILFKQGITPSGFLFYMGIGCFVGMAGLGLILSGRRDVMATTWRDRRRALLSGTMFGIGSLCANLAVKIIGVAVTWPLTKNTVVAVLYGVFVLKEVDIKKNRKALRLGLALSILGVILLAVAMK